MPSDLDTISNYTKLVASSVIPAVLTDPRMADNPIIKCNQAFLDITGYAREEVVGRNCRFLAGPETSHSQQALLRDAIANRQPTITEILNYRKDGTAFVNAVTICPVFNAQGQLLAFFGSQSQVRSDEASDSESPARRAADRLGALTARQREVLTALAAGKQIKQIAYETSLHERTVKLHREAALKALGTANTIEAIRIAIKAGH
jgi:PAS domain S-box-containing protein